MGTSDVNLQKKSCVIPIIQFNYCFHLLIETSILFSHASIPDFNVNFPKLLKCASYCHRGMIIFDSSIIIVQMGKRFLPRVGRFFLLVGLIFLVLFIVSSLGKELKFVYLLGFVGLSFIGIAFIRRAPRTDSGRFRTLRKLSGKNQSINSDDQRNNSLQ